MAVPALSPRVALASAPRGVRILRVLVVALALVLAAAPAWAQPTSVTVSAPVTDATGATFTITWSGGGSFAWSAGFSDGAAWVSRTGTSGSPAAVTMPYASSGAAVTGFICVGPAAAPACAALPVPAKPAGPPPASSTRFLDYTEPRLNAATPLSGTCTTPDIQPCGQPLTDLATMRLYYSLNGAPEIMVPFAASGPAGGAVKTQAITVAATQGTITYAITAVDSSGNETPRSAGVPLTFGNTKPLPAGPGTLQLTR